MKILKPKKIEKGDVIGIITPASNPSNLSTIQDGVKYFENLGYRVEVGKNVGKEEGYLAGSDEERLSDLHSMFANKHIKAILCVRGGYGSGRLLDSIDYNLIKNNPKIFVGYSDITALQMAMFKKTGLVTFAGPMVSTDFSSNVNNYAEENFWNVISNNKKIGKLNNPRDEKFFVLNKGRAEGKLLGGNLAVFTSLIGTKFMPDLKGAILLLEEIGEQPYRIDRLLNQLKLTDVFTQIKGIILGRFVDCYESDKSKKTIDLNAVIANYFSKLSVPLLYSFSHGHVKENLTVPFGINVKLNASRGFVELTESAVV